MAKILVDMEKWELAKKNCEAALKINADLAPAHLILGAVYRAKKKAAEAEVAFRKVLDLKPNNAHAWSNLGVVLREQKKLDESESAYRKALELQPESASFYSNLGNLLRDQHRLQEAKTASEKAAALKPKTAQYHCNLAGTLRELGEFEQAKKSYQQALSLDPSNAEAHITLGMILLAEGDYKNGLAEYEHRWQGKELNDRRHQFKQPEWHGESLQDCTLLVWQEQGFGDFLQMIRFIPHLLQRGAKIVLECQPKLQHLMKSFPGISTLIKPAQNPGQYDKHCPIMSLPARLQTDLSNLPKQIPYISIPKDKLKKWSKVFPKQKKTRVGLVWAGSTSHPNDYYRSMPLDEAIPLLQTSNVDFYSVQIKSSKDDKALLKKHQVTDLSKDIDDFADTAAIFQQLDLLIAVDTSVIHLAGALGRPAWLMVPAVPDWRWLLDRTDSPWYPSVQIFRQKKLGDWSSVIQSIKQALNKLK